jgi:hypothetical protein
VNAIYSQKDEGERPKVAAREFRVRSTKPSLHVLFFILYIVSLVPLGAEDRPGTIDAILLVDKSLSMRSSIETVKRYLSEEVVGALLVPGDRLIIETFYGKLERLFAGTIRSDLDKAQAIRSLNGIAADGAYTDIGAALDRAIADLAELGSPERPKYVLLLTDERQEAPAGSPYVAKDYVLVHPALTWVKRVDMGAFRVITVGLDVEARIDQAAPTVMKLLESPPVRNDRDFPSLPEGSPPGLEGAATAVAATAVAATPPAGSGQGKEAGAGSIPVLAIVLLATVALAAILATAVLSSKRRKQRSEERHDS